MNVREHNPEEYKLTKLGAQKYAALPTGIPGKWFISVLIFYQERLYFRNQSLYCRDLLEVKVR